MRVQRAPLATEQPQAPPEQVSQTSSFSQTSPFSAEIDLDVTHLVPRLEPHRLLAEIVARLVQACHEQGLIDGESPLRVVRPSDDGLVGQQLEQAVRQSAHAIGLAFEALLVELPAPTPRALTVVDLGSTRVNATGDWGLGGVGVVTLGPAVPTVVSHPLADGSGLSLAQRHRARLGFVVPNAEAQAPGVVRVLDAVARSIEQLGR